MRTTPLILVTCCGLLLTIFTSPQIGSQIEAQVSCFSPSGSRRLSVGEQCSPSDDRCVVGASCVDQVCNIDGSTGCSLHNLTSALGDEISRSQSCGLDSEGNDLPCPEINTFSDSSLQARNDQLLLPLIRVVDQTPPDNTPTIPSQPVLPPNQTPNMPPGLPPGLPPPPRSSLLPNFSIVTSHLNYGSIREERMVWYLGSSIPLRGKPRYATLHWTGSNHNPSCAQSIKQFFSPQTKELDGQTIANSCSNFVINKDGSGLEIVPIGLGCIQASNRILNSGLGMSIENCGAGDLGRSLTNSQVLANVQIIGRAIEEEKIAEDTCIVGHYEAAPTERFDPGPNFLRAVCRELKQRGYNIKCSVLGECRPPQTTAAFSPEAPGSSDAFSRRIAGAASKPIAYNKLTQLPSGIYDLEITGYMPLVGIRKTLGQRILFFEDNNSNSQLDESEQPLDSATGANLQITYSKISSAVSYELLSGWNTISLPGSLKSGQTRARHLIREIRLAGGQAETISRLYDGVWESYSVKDGQEYGTNFTIDSNKGYAIFITSPTRIELELNKAESPDPRIRTGWNLIPASQYSSSGAILNTGQADTVSDLYLQSFRTHLNRAGDTFGSDFALLETKSYIVRRAE